MLWCNEGTAGQKLWRWTQTFSAEEPSWVGRLESAGKEECTRQKALSVTFPFGIEPSCPLLPSQNSNLGFDSLLLPSLSHTTSAVRTPGFVVHKSRKGLRKYPDQTSHCSSKKTRPRPKEPETLTRITQLINDRTGALFMDGVKGLAHLPNLGVGSNQFMILFLQEMSKLVTRSPYQRISKRM